MTRDACSGRSNTASPSPCAVTIGSRLPSIPRKKMDGLGTTSTIARRASNCSEVFFTNRGHSAAPGTSSFIAAIIWQPLQTPSAKVSGRVKKAENSSRARPL